MASFERISKRLRGPDERKQHHAAATPPPFFFRRPRAPELRTTPAMEGCERRGSQRMKIDRQGIPRDCGPIDGGVPKIGRRFRFEREDSRRTGQGVLPRSSDRDRSLALALRPAKRGGTTGYGGSTHHPTQKAGGEKGPLPFLRCDRFFFFPFGRIESIDRDSLLL